MANIKQTPQERTKQIIEHAREFMDYINARQLVKAAFYYLKDSTLVTYLTPKQVIEANQAMIKNPFSRRAGINLFDKATKLYDLLNPEEVAA